jgi:hypothetical protein
MEGLLSTYFNSQTCISIGKNPPKQESFVNVPPNVLEEARKKN